MAPDSNSYRPLLAQRMRGPALAIIVVAIIVIAVLGMRYADQDMPGHLDRNVDALVWSRLDRNEPVTRALANLGDPTQVVLLVAAVAGAAALARRWSGVLLTIIGTVAAPITTDLILKPLIGRLRFGHLSFPSGHTATVAAVAIAAAILLVGAQWPRSVALRIVAGLATVALALGVAISLVAEHVHYTTDTVAGFCVAIAIMLALALCLDYWGPDAGARCGRFRRRN